MTYSVLLCDRSGLGYGVVSHYPAVGPAVASIEPSVGVAVVQADGSRAIADRLLAEVRDGASPQEALDRAREGDADWPGRQVAVAARDGRTAGETGDACIAVAGQTLGPGVAIQGNCLRSDEVIAAMADALPAGGELEDRLLGALEAGAAAGGDRRGDMSGALVVARAGQPTIDLRVDSGGDTVRRLGHALATRRLYAMLDDADLLADPVGLERETARLRSSPLEGATEVRLWLAIALARHPGHGAAARAAVDDIVTKPRYRDLLAAIAEVQPVGSLRALVD